MLAKIKKNNLPKKNKKEPAFFVVGISASAGGLEAIEKFFIGIPLNSNIAFVVIQHLSPGYKSIMADLLRKFTKMKVVEITDGIKVEPNIIYLNPRAKRWILSKRPST